MIKIELYLLNFALHNYCVRHGLSDCLEYKAHSMGTNALDMKTINRDLATINNTETENKAQNFVICSAGDDQSISICIFSVETCKEVKVVIFF